MASTANRLLLDIQDLAPDIAARAAEIEAARDMPNDLVEALRSIGIFRMFVPQSHGGLELDLPDGFKVLRALARIEASVGWAATISSVTQIFAPLMQRDTYDEVYQNGPDVIMAGSNLPGGRAEAAQGGWRVSGRWPFASGCRHAEFIGGACVMTKAPAHHGPATELCQSKEAAVEPAEQDRNQGSCSGQRDCLKNARLRGPVPNLSKANATSRYRARRTS
jgi:alkylation response protein AidB-like acyl-CoA dehydrogenase